MQHFFPDRRIALGMIYISRIQLKPCGMKPCIVAGNAKPIQYGPLRRLEENCHGDQQYCLHSLNWKNNNPEVVNTVKV